MEIKIVKGTNQIGGAITIIKSKQARIIIDFGSNLDEKNRIPKIKGLTYGSSSFDAVFITHSHTDHIGQIEKINPDIPIFVEEKSKKIYELTNDFTNQEKKEINTKFFHFSKPIRIKDIKITPLRTDHSAYQSAMFLIETEGKKILHTGDYRSHGRKGLEFINQINKIGKIDILITEGTTLGRTRKTPKTEKDLEEEAKQIFKNYNQVLILQSSTNIDRLVSFYKAATSTKKYFIEDLFTATITKELKKNIPNPQTFSNVSVWIPKNYNKKSINFKEKYITPLASYKNVQNLKKDYAMIIKTTMLEDIKMLKEKGYLNHACLIYSMWEGYLTKESVKKFVEEIKKLGIEVMNLHTSGHADIKAMKYLDKILKPKWVIPIHTTKKEQAKKVFKNALIVSDNKTIKR